MLWTFILTMTFSKATALKINDYSHSDYIPVMDGDVTIWDEFGYLGHSTNITSYEFYALETKIQSHETGIDRGRRTDRFLSGYFKSSS